MNYQVIVGMEVHVQLQTRSKMFCRCSAEYAAAPPNTHTCPICTAMPGVLPAINEQAVEYTVMTGIALKCHINSFSRFARKSYFYPDLPKNYQLTQYELPFCERGYLEIEVNGQPKRIAIRRIHLEEDTAKLTHAGGASLIDFNRSGVPLMEIVSEPDIRSPEEARLYLTKLRTILQYLGVSTGNMEEGAMRCEANISLRPIGSTELPPTHVEVKNLNSFRALERSVAYQIEEQIAALERGECVVQQTLGWDETAGKTFSQRSKEEAHDYRYFPEPDLPPLVVEPEWVQAVAASLPELPRAKRARFQAEFGLSPYEARLLAEDQAVARYFERAAAAGQGLAPRTLALWITGELFGWLNQNGGEIETLRVAPEGLAELLGFLERGEINMATAKTLLGEMLSSGHSAAALIQSRGLRQISDSDVLAALVRQALEENPAELQSYLSGKETLANWFFGQVMRAARGQGNPQVIRAELERQLAERKQAAS